MVKKAATKPTKSKSRKLTTKQRKFKAAILKIPNATQAAIKAGYSVKTAGSIGHELLKKPEIAEAIRADLKKFDIESEDVLRGISRLMSSDLRRCYAQDGQLLPIHQLPDDVAAAIAGIEVIIRHIPGTDPVEVEHVVKIKLWDKTRALEMAGKYKKLFTERVEHSGTLTLEELVAGSREPDA